MGSWEETFVTLSIRPVKVVYFHQQLLELVDYLYQGILGIIISHTVISATQMILRKEQTSIVFSVHNEEPEVLSPIELHDEKYFLLSTRLPCLQHFPTVSAQCCENGPNNNCRYTRKVVQVAKLQILCMKIHSLQT